MSLTPVTPDYRSAAKSLWKKPEGKTAMIALGAIGLALVGEVLFNLTAILTYATNIVNDTTQLLLSLAVLAVVSSPIWSKRVRVLVQNIWWSVMRAITNIFVQTDPIGILRNNIVELKKKGQVFDGALQQVAGAKQRLDSDIANNNTDIQKNRSLAAATDQQIANLQQQLQRADSMDIRMKVQRLQYQKENYLQAAGTEMETVGQEQPLYQQAQKMYEQLSRLRDLAQYKVEGLTMQADMLSKRRDMILASRKGLGAASGILKGDPAQLDIVNQAVEYLNNEADDTIGAMDDFNRWSDKYLTDMDIQKGAEADEAQKMFSQMEQKLQLPNATGTAIPTLPSTSTPNVTSGSSSDYFNN